MILWIEHARFTPAEVTKLRRWSSELRTLAADEAISELSIDSRLRKLEEIEDGVRFLQRRIRWSQ